MPPCRGSVARQSLSIVSDRDRADCGGWRRVHNSRMRSTPPSSSAESWRAGRAWSSARTMTRLVCHCCLEAGRASARQSCRLICGAHRQNSAASAGARVAALALLMRDGLSGYSAAAAWPREVRMRFGTIGGSSSPRCAFSSASRSSRLSSGSGSSAPGTSPASSPDSSDPSSLSR